MSTTEGAVDQWTSISFKISYQEFTYTAWNNVEFADSLRDSILTFTHTQAKHKYCHPFIPFSCYSLVSSVYCVHHPGTYASITLSLSNILQMILFSLFLCLHCFITFFLKRVIIVIIRQLFYKKCSYFKNKFIFIQPVYMCIFNIFFIVIFKITLKYD